MNNEVKQTVLRTLKRRKDILTHKGNYNIPFLEGRVKELKQELESKQQYSCHSIGGGLGVEVEIHEDTHTKIIRDFEERLERSRKEKEDLEKAIEYIEQM